MTFVFDGSCAVLQLIEQLKPGGRLIIPVGPTGENQKLMQVCGLILSCNKKSLDDAQSPKRLGKQNCCVHMVYSSHSVY
jgi:protein-L-isoaspartate O-methyltransferase